MLNNGKGKRVLLCDYTGDLEYEYTGEIENGGKNGKGVEYCSETEVTYVGDFLNGQKGGKGKEFIIIN